MAIKKITKLVLQIGEEELILVPITRRKQTVSLPLAGTNNTTSTSFEFLDVASKTDKVIGYLVDPGEVKE